MWKSSPEQSGCLTNLSKKKHHWNTSGIQVLCLCYETELQDYCEDYYLKGKTKPWRFIVPSSRLSTCSLDQLKSCCAHVRKKGGKKKKNVNSLKGKYAALKDTDIYKQLLCEESESKFSSLAHQAIQRLYRLWETRRINATVMPEMSPPCALHKKESYRNLQLVSSVLHPGYCLKTALYRFYLRGRQWGFRSAKSPDVRIRAFGVSLGVIITSGRYVMRCSKHSLSATL